MKHGGFLMKRFQRLINIEVSLSKHQQWQKGCRPDVGEGCWTAVNSPKKTRQVAVNQNCDMSMASRRNDRNVQISRTQHFSRRRPAVRLCLLASFALLLRPAFTGYVRQRCPSTMTASQAGEAGWWDQLVWNAAETLGNARASLVGSEPEMPMGEAPISRDELVERLRADYDHNYFLTGDVDVPLYTDDCEFADPFTSFRGRQRFVQNLKKLSLECEGSWFQVF